MSAPAVFLTGGTGLVGTALVRRLRGEGREVHALVRPTSRTEVLSELGCRLHVGALEDADSVTRALEAARDAAGDALDVVHSAAVISYRTGDRALQERVNVGGTRAVLAAARAVDARRLLHISSVVAVGHSERAQPIDEDHVFNSAGLHVDYVDTKRAAEELALAAADELDVVVVNPGAIFGPLAAGSNTAKFVMAVRERTAGPFAPPGGLSVVGVADVADACVRALDRGARGRRYILTERYYSSRDLFRLVASELGVRPVWGALPAPLWRAAVPLVAVVDRIRRLELATPQALRMVGVHYNLDAGRARSELGWAPAPFPEVLRVLLDEAGLRA